MTQRKHYVARGHDERLGNVGFITVNAGYSAVVANVNTVL